MNFELLWQIENIQFRKLTQNSIFKKYKQRLFFFLSMYLSIFLLF